MKKRSRLPVLFTSFVTMFAGFGCKKESADPVPAELIARVWFLANGQTYSWNGPYPGTSSQIQVLQIEPSVLYLNDPQSAVNYLVIKMKFSTLALGTYRLTIDTTTSLYNAPHYFQLSDATQAEILANIPVPFTGYASTDIGDYGTVTITSIHDGHYVDGTFSAQMTKFTQNDTTTKLYFTNGTFQNLPALFR